MGIFCLRHSSCITEMKGAILCCFLLLVVCLVNARNPKDKYGILFVHEIVANYDTRTVQIEDSIVKDRTLYVDVIEEWNGDGVRSEGIFFNDGDVVLADDFIVNPPTVFPNRVNANGGIYADGGLEDFSSFTVEDDTGRTSVRGIIFVEGGIFTPGDAFTVAGEDGETTVRDADLNANGGINVNDGSFTVSPDGELFTASTLNVQGTVFLGDNSTQDRYVRRVFTAAQQGGDTIISAQTGTSSGGNLLIVPGIATDCQDPSGDAFTACNDGSIFLGRQTNDNIEVTRPTASGSAARTTYNGQDSINGDGGDILFNAGDSTGDGIGGDIILIPGQASNGNHGKIYLGTDSSNAAASFPLEIQRPDLVSGNGGDTIIQGQNTQSGPAGDLYILSGQSTGLQGAPLYLIPGDANQDFDNNEEQGDIVFDTTPIIIDNSYFEIQKGSESVVIRADPTSIISYNGKTVLRSVSDYIIPAVPIANIAPANDPRFTDTAYRIAQLQNSLEILINALGQCQHGLLETVDSVTGIPDSCTSNVPSFVPALP